MPPPVLLPGAIMVSKKLAFHAAAYFDAATFTSATVAFILARWLFERIPQWVKDDITFRKLIRNNSDGREELSHVGSVIDKLRALAQSASIEPVPHLHAALLAYIQLLGQLKYQQIQRPSPIEENLTRDYLYKRSGKEIPLMDLRSKEYRDALEFATWAYYDDTALLKEKLDIADYTVLKHSISSRPGTVSYYLAIQPESKQLLCCVRGTSSLEDILTDCCGRAVPLDALEDDTIRIEVQAASSHFLLENEDDDEVEIISGHEKIVLEQHDDDGDKFIRCHEGILISAENLAAEIEPLIGDLIRLAGFRLVLCGHSLGAGAAVLAAVLLRNHIPELLNDQEDKIRVYGFAPPPTLDYDSAVSASSFCTSIVCNADIIPRCSISNMSVLFECLRRVQERLADKSLLPTWLLTTQNFIKKLSEGISGEPLVDAEELNTVIENAYDKIEIRKPEHLFIPGRVLLVYNPWQSEDTDSEVTDESDPVDWRCIETDGAANVFRNIEFDGPRPFADHMTTSYFRALDTEYDF